ncbi:sulfate permease [Leucobacter triazinivorans]|uniref:Sulfate permease n=1 Tax=Leucobacter triazinivorans TaxID=1784719 RepID=A0A4P6KBK2_9MICO|nr:sulfate permease [Leucobacter triazinivorans]QBE47666.1 sulfate permease [Leucobacter triazinivorans]
MFRLIWIISIYVRSFMRRFIPTNIALDALRTRRGLKWGVPAMLLAIPYCFVAAYVTALIDDGATNCLYLVVLVCIWNAFKFVLNGIVCMGLLARVRVHERRLQRSAAEAPAVYANEQLVRA